MRDILAGMPPLADNYPVSVYVHVRRLPCNTATMGFPRAVSSLGQTTCRR